MEYPGREGFTLSLSQQFHCAGWQYDFPCSRIGLGIPRYQPAALFTVKSSVDFQDAAALIEVRPHETADFTPAQTGGQFGVEEVVPYCVFLNHIHKSIQLFLIQNFHWLMDCFGRLHPISRVDGDKSLISCRFECVVERGVDAVYGSTGQPSVLAGSRLYSAALLQGIIEFS